MRFLAVCGLLLLTTSPCHPQVASKVEPIDKAMLVNIKSVVANSYKGEESLVYKVISVRLSQCSFLFSTLAKRSKPTDTPSPVTYVNLSEAYYKVSAAIYPDSSRNFDSGIANVNFFEEILKIMEDKQKTLYFIERCLDFSEPKIDTVALAITEMMLQLHEQHTHQ
jgi:hypothetical protein